MNYFIAQDKSARRFSALIAVMLLFCAGIFALAADDWPMWLGDSGSGAAGLQNKMNTSRFTPPRQLWSSVANFGGVRAHVPDNRKALDESKFDLPHMGGYGSPIAADGKVFLAHYRPSGSIYDKYVAHQQLKMTQAELNAQRGKYPDGLIRKHERWLSKATDLLTCIDAATGKTLWETKLTDQGINFNLGNKTGMGVTPAYHQGRVFVFGTAGDIFAVDAESGRIEWEADIGERAQMQRLYMQMVENGYSYGPRFRSSFLTAVVAADGVVVVSDEIFHRVDLGAGTDYHYDRQNGPMAFEAATGKRIWHRPEEGGGCPPVIWRHAGKAYVVSAGNEGISLIDIKSGRRLWRSGFGHSSGRSIGPAVAGDYMVINFSQAGAAGEVVAYRLKLDGPEELWRLPHKLETNFVIAGDKGYAVMGENLVCVDMTTGAVLQRAPSAVRDGASGNAYLLYYGGWLFAPSVRGRKGISFIPSEPERMERTGGVIEIDYAPGYENVIMPAFIDGSIIVRGKFKIDSFSLPQ